MPVSLTFDFGALDDPEALGSRDCGCGCAGKRACGTDGAQQWLRVSGAPQSWGAAKPMPVPLMAGVDDAEPLGAFGAERECETGFSIDGKPPSDPCGLFCVPSDWAKWTDAALHYLDLAERGKTGGAIAVLGKGPLVAKMRVDVVAQVPSSEFLDAAGRQPGEPPFEPAFVPHNMLSVEELANIVVALRCLIEDAAKVQAIDPVVPAPSEGPKVTPSTGPSAPLFPSLFPDIPTWAKVAGVAALVYLITRR